MPGSGDLDGLRVGRHGAEDERTVAADPDLVNSELIGRSGGPQPPGSGSLVAGQLNTESVLLALIGRPHLPGRAGLIGDRGDGDDGSRRLGRVVVEEPEVALSSASAGTKAEERRRRELRTPPARARGDGARASDEDAAEVAVLALPSTRSHSPVSSAARLRAGENHADLRVEIGHLSGTSSRERRSAVCAACRVAPTVPGLVSIAAAIDS